MNWITLPLGEVATVTSGQSPPGHTYNDNGLGLPFFQGKADFGEMHPVTRKWCAAPIKIADAGDILISVRAPVGPTNIATERCCIGRGLAAVRVDENMALRDFVHWILKHRQPELVSKGQGSTFSAIGQKDLKSLSIPLPSLGEQRRIVSILNRTAKIESLRKKAEERLLEFFPALFVRIFGGQDQVATRYPCIPLREVAEIRSGVTKGRKIEAVNAIEVPYLRVANVQDGFLKLDEIKAITIRRGEERKFALAPGDLVMTEGGDPDKLGRAAVWNGELGYCAHQNHVFRVRPNTEVVLTDYLRDAAGSAYGKAYFLSVAKQTTGIASINKTQLGGFPVPVPPMELQVLYAKIVATAHEIASVSEAAAGKIATLSSSLFPRLLESPTLGKQIRSTRAGSQTRHTVVQP